ncbi:MAG: 6-bladed beta-propeller, partial [Gracilimonas sp.]
RNSKGFLPSFFSFYRTLLIQNYGRGPGEFMGPYDFVLNEKEDEIIIYSAMDAKLSFFDIEDGSFIKDKPLNFWMGRFEKLDEGFVFFLNNRLTKETEYNVIFTDDELRITDEFLKMKQGLIGYHYKIPMNFYAKNDSIFFISPSDYNVYYINSSVRSFKELKHFDFGDRELPDSYFEKHPDNQSRRDEAKDAVSTILSYLEGPGFESMFYSINTTTYTYLRSKETDKVIHTNNEKLEMDMNIGPMYRWPRTAYENSLVWYQQPGSLLRELNEIKDTLEEDEWAEFVNENRKLVSFAQTLTGDENPYLIFTKVSF